MLTKVCRICKEARKLDAFYVRPKSIDGLRHECKKCHGKNGRKNYLRRKPAIDEKLRTQHLMRQYKMTPEQWQGLYDSQEGKCAICCCAEMKYNNKSKTTQKLCADHDHTTGKVRGLACNRCNTILGRVNEDVNLLRAMLAYLERHRSDLTLGPNL